MPNISRFEITGVFTHPNAKADIVLVHGVNGHPRNTWTAKNGTFWPVELLPKSLQDEHANILVYGYNADAYSRGKDQHASHNIILQHAQTLVTNLTVYRKSNACFKNPIIWVAHSFGGILVKRALLYSNDLRATDHGDLRSIYVSTYGIIFLGTPHAGSILANLGLYIHQASRITIPRSIFQSESALLKTLKRDNERLREINNQFLNIYERFKIHMVHENHKTDLKITRALVVDGPSAGNPLPGATYYGIEATHSNMCKFKDINAPGYLIISTAIRDWVGDSTEVIKNRWDNEKEDRHAKVRRDIDEMQKSSVSNVE
ncbi:hypothetical protein CI102_5881 [Trichoderma harzianum]|uniref:DUF676 domain-containing protein n=1 Tax=Trichoderma harzianum CBS 226.95 TaxID=983964 RepID=A0A2T4A153_TRIHA|nr:hypothetical protein M431DRAFT_94507 [Trichoderma harzianum CBS 226.95]PKK51844.1 hypothetical protein CI102_5881 [Trichoderma harzianum]PTB50794.1 hypothetical protein M431DRAFT_94507 [Trichoderma harzianum CBS 226.95]